MKFLLPILLLFLASCAQVQKNPTNSVSGVEAEEQDQEEDVTPVDESVPAAQNDLNDNESDLNVIPHEFNKEVQMWVDYFTGRGRHHMVRYLSRSSRYMPKMKEILRKNALPEDLVYISLIESGFSPTAHSWANAVGYWQFIRGTGKRYGLHIDPLVDERRDFLRSTEAAAGYYKDLYSLFGSWYLAIASYNVGEGKVKRAVVRHYTRDFWVLARKRALPKETIHYVPKYLAARMIAKHPERFGFTGIDYLPPLDWEEIKVEHSVDLKKLAQEIGADEAEVLGLNPSFSKGVAPLYSGTHNILRVPRGYSAKATEVAANCKVSENFIAQAASSGYFWYKVKRGDTIHRIAKRFKVGVSTLREINSLRSTRMYKGRRLKIPETGYQVARSTSHPLDKPETQSVAQQENLRPETSHKVKRGETLNKIAKKYGVTVADLITANNFKSKRSLKRGMVLTIPGEQPREVVAVKSEGKGSIAAQVYRVQPGDTLSAIARKHGVKIDEIRELNQLGRRSVLYSGQEIKVPSDMKPATSRFKGSTRSLASVRPTRSLGALQSSRTYRVKRGDTVYSIARVHGMKTDELVKLNALKSSTQIQTGQKLKVR